MFVPRTWLATALLIGCASLACSADSQASLPGLPKPALEGMDKAVREQIQETFHAAQEDPSDANANGRLGMVFHAYAQYGQAETCYRRARRLDPEEFQWAYYLGTVQFLQGKDAEAITTLQEALQLDSAYLPARLKLAEALLASGQFNKSRQIYSAVTREHPKASLAHYGLGRVESAQGNVSAAIEHYRKACELSNTFGAAHYALALAYRDIGDAAKSKVHFSFYQKHQGGRQPVEDPLLFAVSELKKDRSKDHFKRGLSLADAGELAEAIQHFERAIEINPELLQARVNLISLYGGMGQIESAEQQYREAIKLGRDSADLHFNFGVLMGQQQEYQKAEMAFRKALEADPSFAEAHNNLGQMLEAQGQTEQAMDHYRLALKHKPDYRLAHFHMGRMSFAQGDKEEATRHFLSTLTPEDEETPKYMLDVAVAFARMGDTQKAEDFAGRAKQRAVSLGQAEVEAMSDKILRKLEETGP